MNTPRKNRIVKIIVWIVGVIILIAALLVVAAFFWPATSKQLQSSNSEKLNYNQSVAAAIRTINGDSSNTDVRPECRSIIKTHSQKSPAFPATASPTINDTEKLPFQQWLNL